MKNGEPRNVIYLDGLPWINRAGQVWGDYDVCAEYIGVARSSFPAYVWRHNLPTISHGRKKIVRKRDLDRISGASTAEGSRPASEQLPLRGRRRASVDQVRSK